ncbi:hypothetical protein DE146DRAFT_760624 [Phaeosphaeria sp. MPI-PUGE-AT-0046c]|nr:hypothetical protein DE146DRAFT_760624 [Phaeosphaeria sp. MPI-PUGE-AT-0046c]
MPSVIANKTEARGLIIVIVLCVLATVGMFCLIITLVICKNKRDRRKRAARLASDDPTAYIGGAGMIGGEGMMRGAGTGGQRGRYQKLEDEEGGVWSVEMEERMGGRGTGGEGSAGRYEMVGGAGRDGNKDTYR